MERSSGALLNDRRGPIRDDFRHRLTKLRGVEAHHDDRIGAHGARVLDHAVNRVAACVLDEARVLDDLAAPDRPQAGHDVAAQAAAAHNDPEHLPQSLLYLVAGWALGGGYQKWSPGWRLRHLRLLQIQLYSSASSSRTSRFC